LVQIGEQRNGIERQVFIYDKGIDALEDISAELMWWPLEEENNLVLCWRVLFYEKDAQNWHDLIINASSGEVINSTNRVVHCSFESTNQCNNKHNGSSIINLTNEPFSPTTASYNVYDIGIESPNHGNRSIVTDPWLRVGDINSLSDEGWHDDNGTTYAATRGNNVDAYLDDNNSNSPTGGDTARALSASFDFDFTFNQSLTPINNKNASLTNLFFWNNIIHDVLYLYGFDEPAGNFQESNFGNGGAASDYVRAEGQDGGGMNNANFATPADGGNPRMQMYNWNFTGSYYPDGDFDNGIIAHEYGHGWSNRLTGGPGSAGCLGNSEQMGEGWSDYLGLMLTTDWATATATEGRGIGTYARGEATTGPGIRTYRYSTDFGVNPFTYDDIKLQSVPHGVGSVWATMLWEMTWEIMASNSFDPDFYQGTGGNNVALNLVTEGLKLQPCQPGFVDARDAILQADQAIYNGAHQCAIWTAFAKRGLGQNANQGSVNSKTDGTQDFTLPSNACSGGPTCTVSVSPSTVSVATGGGANSVQVSATSGQAWTAATSANWITLNTTSGTGNGTLNFTVAANTGGARNATINVTCGANSGTVTVSQSGASGGCVVSVSPSTVSETATGGSNTVQVSATSGQGWTATTQATWISIASPTGNGSGSLTFNVAANTGSARNAHLHVV